MSASNMRQISRDEVLRAFGLAYTSERNRGKTLDSEVGIELGNILFGKSAPPRCEQRTTMATECAHSGAKLDKDPVGYEFPKVGDQYEPSKVIKDAHERITALHTLLNSLQERFYNYQVRYENISNEVQNIYGMISSVSNTLINRVEKLEKGSAKDSIIFHVAKIVNETHETIVKANNILEKRIEENEKAMAEYVFQKQAHDRRISALENCFNSLDNRIHKLEESGLAQAVVLPTEFLNKIERMMKEKIKKDLKL